MADTVGMADVQGETVSRVVKGFALEQYKFKQVCSISSSTSRTETYYRETATALTGATPGEGIEGVPRLAEFPNAEVSWTKVSGINIKFGDQGVISVEDRLLDAIDVQGRTFFRIAESVAAAVDSYIYSTMSGASGINTAAAVAAWDSATVADRDPIRDILTGIQYINVDRYDAQKNGYLLLSPLDYTNLMMNSKVINNPSFKTADVVSNGVVGQICGLNIIVSNNVTADEALIVVGQRAATWKTVAPLTTKIIDEPGIKQTIRSWEIGHLQVTDPEAIHKITNTQA